MRKTTKKTAAAAVALAVMATFPACGSKDREEVAGAAAYPMKIEVVDGIRTVTNPDFPRDGRSAPSLVEELTIGEKEGAEEYLFNRPQWLRVDAMGRIFVMDWGDICIKIFGTDGRLLRSIGRQGQGPGEFDIPSYFDLDPDGRIVIMDGRNSRVAILDEEGRSAGGFRVEGFHSGMVCDSAGRIYIQNQRPEKEVEAVSSDFSAVPYTTTVWRTDPEGKDLERIGDFGGEVRGMRRTPDGGSISVSPPFTNLWTVDRSDRFVIGFNTRIDLTVYGPDLKPAFRFRREFVPLKSPHYSGQAWQNEFYPALERFFILADEEGNFWLERAFPPTLKKPEEPGEEPEWISSPDHIYDVFDKDGIYIREVTLPFRISSIRGGKFYAMVRDEEGFVRVKRFRIGP